MIAGLSRLSMMTLAVAILSIFLPQLYDKAFSVKVAPTQMFYSPTEKQFVFREHFGDHNFLYLDEVGNSFDRKTFETKIPFIYYKNMDIWGLLPLEIDGKSYDKRFIKNNRQVFEIKPHEVIDNAPRIEIYPLLESNPGRARLRFPEDVFRMTDDRMEFINVDINQIDEKLTSTYTKALTDAGFAFPAKIVAGKNTILKPFDEGFFIQDTNGAVFHIKRLNETPVVVKTGIPNDLDIRFIKVSENKRKVYYGALLTQDNRLFMISYDDYKLVELPSKGYNPDTMNYKLLINPVNKTAVFGDKQVIHAVAMDADFQQIADYQRPVPGTSDMLYKKVEASLFPFVVTLDKAGTGFLHWAVSFGSMAAVIGCVLSLAAYVVFLRWRTIPLQQAIPDMVLVALTGVYGLIAATVVLVERRIER